jgi:exodeoxyribonuclease V alpha subunit
MQPEVDTDGDTPVTRPSTAGGGRFEGREVAYDFGELDAIVPAYATTVHKAQGSEDPAVVVPLVTQHWGMLPRNPVDTAVPRGQRLVVVVSRPKALALAVAKSAASAARLC